MDEWMTADHSGVPWHTSSQTTHIPVVRPSWDPCTPELSLAGLGYLSAQPTGVQVPLTTTAVSRKLLPRTRTDPAAGVPAAPRPHNSRNFPTSPPSHSTTLAMASLPSPTQGQPAG